jgi:hypothetical protein
MSVTVQAWCFSHGRMHTFGSSDGAWCTADWVDLGASNPALAEDRKRAHFGDARFMHDLPLEAQEAVMQQVQEREQAAKEATT